MLWIRQRRPFWLLVRGDPDPLARPRPDLQPVELHRPARRPRGAGGAALVVALDGRRGRRRRSSARRCVVLLVGGKGVTSDRINVDTSRSRPPDLRRRRTVLRTAAVGLWLRLLPEGLQQPPAKPTKGAGDDLPHRADHRRRRAGPDRPGRLRRPRRRLALDDGRGALGTRSGPASRRTSSIARAAILAAFVALLVHTMAYAGFFQDPITWVLMAVGASLAPPAAHRRARPTRGAGRRSPGPGVGSPRVGIPEATRHHRRRLHGGEHPLEADRGRAAAALHAAPRHRPTTAAAELLFAAVVTASIVVRLGLIESVLRFYYRDDEDPTRVVGATFSGLFWFATIGALIALPFAGPLAERCSTSKPRRTARPAPN